MKLINELKKEESKDKPKCEIKFEKHIGCDGKLNITVVVPEQWKFISIIAHIDSDRYIFEAYELKHHKRTNLSAKYVGTWNGVEQ